HDDPLTRLQSFADDPESAHTISHLDLADLGRVTGADCHDLVLSLKVPHGPLGNEERSLFDLDDGAYLRELPRAQKVIRVREDSPDIDGAGRRADLPVHDLGRPRVRVRRAVGKRHLELALLVAHVVRVTAALPPAHVLL